jgi:sugar/nucleoside kinase (ribokinase family)
VVRDRPTPTCYTVEDQRGGQRTMIDQGPMADDGGPYTQGPSPADCAWVHLTTGPPSAHLELAARARAAGARVAIDPAQEIHYRWNAPKFRRLLATAEVLFGNRSEIARAEELAGVRSPAALLERVPLIVRTEGAQGATAFSRAGALHVAARAARRRRTIVGAGDAFRGGFYAGWFAGRPLEECLGAGARAATGWVEGAR